jgi:hypothetical protein
MADKTPKELISILLVTFIFIFGYAGFYSSLSMSYSSNYTELSTLNKTAEIMGVVENQFQTVNNTMTQNPKSGSYNIFLDTPGMLANAGVTMGYLFLSIPGWFQSLFNDMSATLGIIPSWLIAIGFMFIMLELISWFVYFWTNRRT